jgi:hypothetical protein
MARLLQRTTNEDLEHLRNQCITVEVNMARLFNFDVKRRKTAQAKQVGWAKDVMEDCQGNRGLRAYFTLSCDVVNRRWRHSRWA